MFLRSLVGALVLLAVSLPVDVLSCGDKFLVPGRVTRFGLRTVDRGTATVLLYARPGSPFDDTLRTQAVETRLRAAGYRPTVVTNPDALSRQLHGASWDVVVTDLVDAAAVTSGNAPSAAPVILPVAHQLPKADLNAARERYGRVMRLPLRYQALLEAIDDVVAERAKARARTTTRAGD